MKTSIYKIFVVALAIFMTSFCVNGTIESPHSLTTEGSLVLEKTNNKYALIIAIGAYNKETTGWTPISSGNDIPLITNALKTQGFPKDNITLIKDEKADKEEILKALTDLSNKVKEGDIVVIHYSGHGQQIFDNNGDELDGYDETLVTINAPARFHKIPEYTGQHHIRDEEFGNLITEIRKKVGKSGHVLVIMDSCHSGTGTRGGFNKARGGEKPLAPDNYNPEKKMEEGSGLNDKTHSRGNEGGLGNFVLFSGARFDELNYETQDEQGNNVGSLSYSFSKAMTQIEPAETYRSFFAKILSEMAEVAPNQSPMIEGDIDAVFFGGDENIKTQTPYFNIKEIINGTEIIIDGGMVHNLTSGSKVGLYKIGTKDPMEEKEKLISEGTVEDVSTFNSKVVFESEIGLKNEKSAWAFVSELNIENKKLKVSLAKLEGRIRDEISQKLNNIPVVILTDVKPDLMVIPASIADSPPGRSASPDAMILRSGDIDIATDETKVGDAIINYARGQYLKQIEYWDELYQVDFEFIPVEMKRTSNGWEELKRLNIEDFMVNGIPEFPVGTQLKLRIKNEGSADAYFNIIDIQPDGYINPIAPNISAGLPPEECRIEANSMKEISNYFLTIGPPLGLETFKVFSTPEIINLEPIIRSQGTQSRSTNPSELRGLEKLLSETYTGTRGAPGSSVIATEGSSFNRNFKIIE